MLFFAGTFFSSVHLLCVLSNRFRDKDIEEQEFHSSKIVNQTRTEMNRRAERYLVQLMRMSELNEWSKMGIVCCDVRHDLDK